MDVFHQLFICSFLLTLGHARGPHHPRGAEIVKRHVHVRPSKDVKLTEDVELLHDREHIQEHLEEELFKADILSMTDDDLEFYFFQLHDTDKNLKLDGLEILQAIIHTNDHDYDNIENEFEEEPTQPSVMTTDLYVDLIDRVLKEDDYNNDGYLSYEEYKSSRKDSKMIGMGKAFPTINHS